LNPSQLPHRKTRRGFTLVEVALALLVVAVGLTAMLGLFPVGLKENQRAIDEARSAMFAEEVFNSIRAYILVRGWQTGWAELSGGTAIPGVAPAMYKDPLSATRIVVASNFVVNKYEFVQGDFDSHAHKYQIRIENHSLVRKGVVLTVMPGAFTAAPTEDNSSVYYTEFFNFAMAP
jgi:prepilin-type N-terminal cleavage/methylation domain-containing protein